MAMREGETREWEIKIKTLKDDGKRIQKTGDCRKSRDLDASIILCGCATAHTNEVFVLCQR